MANREQVQKEILKNAEQSKQRGDILFSKGSYLESIEAYDHVIKLLDPFRGGPLGEKLAVQALTNKAQNFTKLGDHEKAIETIDFALSVPIITFETHLMSKLYYRKGLALRSLGRLEDALEMLDRAICIGGGDTYGLEEDRQKVIEEIEAESAAFAPPEHPDTISSEEVISAIMAIVENRGNPDVVIPRLQNLLDSKTGKIWLDKRDDEKKINMVFAVCNVAMSLAMSKEDPDSVFPLLGFLYSKGARAEQRYPLQGNRTPLQMLCLAGATKCIMLSLKFGATTRVYDDNRWTPLLIALSPDRPRRESSAAIVDLLLKNHALVNHVNHTGLTALSLAAQSGDADAVKVLLQAPDIKLNLRDQSLFSSIVWAKIGGAFSGRSDECVELIKAAAIARDATAEVPSLRLEITQDLFCFDFSTVVYTMKNYPPLLAATEESARDQIVIDLLRKVFNKLNGSINEGQDSDATSTTLISEYERFWDALHSTYPIAAFKRYGLKPSTMTAEEANKPQFVQRILSQLQLNDHCWFNTLYLTRGPPKEPLFPIKCNDRNDFYYLTLFEDFHKLVLLPLQRTFGFFVPSLASITQLQNSLSESEISKLKAIDFPDVQASLRSSNIKNSLHEKFSDIVIENIEVKDGTDVISSLSSSFSSIGANESILLDASCMAASPDFQKLDDAAIASLGSAFVNSFSGKVAYFIGFNELDAGEEKYSRPGSFSDSEDLIRSISLSMLSTVKKTPGFKVSMLSALPNWYVAAHGVFRIEKNDV